MTAQDITLKKFYGSPNNAEVANVVAEFPGGGFVFAGTSGSHSPTDQDAFLMRVDSNGTETSQHIRLF